MKTGILVIVILLSLQLAAQASETGVIVRLSPVYAEASTVSTRIGRINAGTSVSVFERNGGWKQIYSEEKAILGWVRSFQVRQSALVPTAKIESEPDSRGFLAGLATFSRKASGFFKSDSNSTSSTTATIGIRGLSADQIKAAKPDFAELARLQQFTSNSQRQTAFTRQGGLRARSVKHLPKY
jgi:hypothetical protein